jgi:hypothetical protein
MRMDGCTYRGKPSAPTITMALANSGEMQIELIQQHGDTPSIYQEFLAATGGGLNQVAYWVDDFAGVCAAAADAGWVEVWGGASGGTHFAYFEHADSPLAIVEVMQYDEATSPMRMIREAAAAWTPGDPILLA